METCVLNPKVLRLQWPLKATPTPTPAHLQNRVAQVFCFLLCSRSGEMGRSEKGFGLGFGFMLAAFHPCRGWGLSRQACLRRLWFCYVFKHLKDYVVSSWCEQFMFFLMKW